IPDAAGFAIAGLVGAVAAAIAVRWSSQVVGGIGILGALLAPVLVDAGTSSASLAFMAVALVAAVAVLVWQRWPWLAFGSFVVGWAVHAVLLAWLARRTEDERATVGAIGFLVLALGHVLVFEAPPDALANGLDDAAKGLIGIAVVAVAAALASRLVIGREP